MSNSNGRSRSSFSALGGVITFQWRIGSMSCVFQWQIESSRRSPITPWSKNFCSAEIGGFDWKFKCAPAFHPITNECPENALHSLATSRASSLVRSPTAPI
uniref:Uncharacterized protein n=1 Tax=Rhipicephalus microplus TaxID=6941 RepID=A0A6G5AFI9_RHIMP